MCITQSKCVRSLCGSGGLERCQRCSSTLHGRGHDTADSTGRSNRMCRSKVLLKAVCVSVIQCISSNAVQEQGTGPSRYRVHYSDDHPSGPVHALQHGCIDDKGWASLTAWHDCIIWCSYTAIAAAVGAPQHALTDLKVSKAHVQWRCSDVCGDVAQLQAAADGHHQLAASTINGQVVARPKNCAAPL